MELATATICATAGKGVLTAVANVEGETLEAVSGIEATE
jgi:predicted secreted protein